MNCEKELDKYLIILNKDSCLTPEREEWLKENFEYVPYKDEDGESFMETETYKAYCALVEIMKKKHLVNIFSHSAWRSVETQEKIYKEALKLYDEEWVTTHVALPGESEHHTGLAFDLKLKYDMIPMALKGKVNSLYGKLGIKKHIFNIIEKEAAKLGLIKRFKKGKEKETGFAEEDWHFRYVGVAHAMEMYKSGMCLEEYVKSLKLNNQKIKENVR